MTYEKADGIKLLPEEAHSRGLRQMGLGISPITLELSR
jgi:hypothetical protein